jgi:hypothetical protein
LVISAAGAQAREADTDMRLDALLGKAREGAEVVLAARGAGLPSPAERGLATEADLETLIEAAASKGDEEWRCLTEARYFCDDLSDEIADRDAWNHLGRIARVMLDGAPRNLTDGAQFYHTKAVSPYWADEFYQTAEIGAHLFYVEDQVQMASNASN